MKGRTIFKGSATGPILKTDQPMGFFGHIEPETGIYKDAGHPLDGKCLKGTVLAFPRAKGSTVGSYIIYALRKTGMGPVAMLLQECDTIVAVGSIIGEIPTLDGIDMSALEDGAVVTIKDGEVIPA